MSKTYASLGPLVGILRFDAPSSSTRTLSATQAYDASRSQIVLGSFTGKLTDKTAREKDDFGEPWGVALTTTVFGGKAEGVGAGAKRDVDGISSNGTGTVTLSAVKSVDVKSGKAAIECGCTPMACYPCTTSRVTFSGMAIGSPINLEPEGSSYNSKATNANTTYYGAITVALGEYKKWQGNYAVLKINTVTEKAVLRIYAD